MNGGRGLSGRRSGARFLVELGTAALVMVTYLVVVVGGGAVLRLPPPNLPLAVLATAIVAVTLEPARRQLRRLLLVTPHDRLARFASTLAAVVATDEVAPGMARLIAEATGSRRVEVWLRHGDAVDAGELAARWPSAAGPIDPTAEGTRTQDIRSGGRVLGRLVRDLGDAGTMSPLEHRLVDDLIDQAGAALSTVALTAELADRVEQRTVRAAELRASRQRIVATSDAARRRLERDIHDGAQQHLVALAVNVSLAATVAGRDPSRSAQLLTDLAAASRVALATLDELVSGIHPHLLDDAGLAAALRAAVATSPVPVRIEVELTQRPPREVESAVYFGSLEAVQNALKHAAPEAISVTIREQAGSVSLLVRDDGRGFDLTAHRDGMGLSNLADRIESVGGTFTITTRPGAGTSVSARIPMPADVTRNGSRDV